MYLDDLLIEELDEVEFVKGWVAALSWVQIRVDVDEDTHEVVDIYLEGNGPKPVVLSAECENKALWTALKAAIEREYRGAIIEHVREVKRGRKEAAKHDAFEHMRDTWANP